MNGLDLFSEVGRTQHRSGPQQQQIHAIVISCYIIEGILEVNFRLMEKCSQVNPKRQERERERESVKKEDVREEKIRQEKSQKKADPKNCAF